MKSIADVKTVLYNLDWAPSPSFVAYKLAKAGIETVIVDNRYFVDTIEGRFKIVVNRKHTMAWVEAA